MLTRTLEYVLQCSLKANKSPQPTIVPSPSFKAISLYLPTFFPNPKKPPAPPLFAPLIPPTPPSPTTPPSPPSPPGPLFLLISSSFIAFSTNPSYSPSPAFLSLALNLTSLTCASISLNTPTHLESQSPSTCTIAGTESGRRSRRGAREEMSTRWDWVSSFASMRPA